jgi:hypothetical protein
MGAVAKSFMRKGFLIYEEIVESLEFGQLETATSLYICRMCVVLIIVYARVYTLNRLLINIPVFRYTLPY